jgi:hypothetical protein
MEKQQHRWGVTQCGTFRFSRDSWIAMIQLFLILFSTASPLLRRVCAMSPNYNFRNAGRVAPFGFPDPSRTLPTSTPINNDPNSVIISSRCSCGSVLIEFPYPKSEDTADDPPIMDCHCASCRRFHMAAFVRYLQVPANGVAVSGDSVVRFDDRCSESGVVQRIYCRRCSSKLMTKKVTGEGKMGMDTGRSMPPLSAASQSTVLINMGPINSDALPSDIVERWKQAKVRQWSPNMEASWARARLPQTFYDHDYEELVPEKPPSTTVTGGCTCGACQYEFQFTAPSEMQHCYCNLCRQLSGGLFMTWVPVAVKDQRFRWIRNAYVAPQQPQSSVPDRNRRSTDGENVPLVRYTDIGQRHMCLQCGSNLSILYDVFAFDDVDDDDAVIWLSAAGFDSIRFPFRVEPYLSRLLHICCRFKPEWYELPPEDGIPRVADAS